MKANGMKTASSMAAFAMFAAIVASGCSETKTKTVEVSEPRISITGAITVDVGATVTWAATTLNGEAETYTWASSDEAVATVADGTITGVAAGVAEITVTGADSGLTAKSGIVVLGEGGGGEGDPALVITGDYRLEPGQTTTLSVTTLNAEAETYTFASSAEAVATVDADGVVTAVADGVAEITVTGVDSGATAKHGIVVVEEMIIVPPEVTVEVSADAFFLEIGQTAQLEATTYNAEAETYTWATSDADVATVDTDGLVTAIGPGEAIVTATGADSGKSGAVGIAVAEEGMALPPFHDQWVNSGHADSAGEAFAHWDEDGEVPASCARCHSEGGYLDWVGADGTAPFSVEGPAAIGTNVSCNTCHNAATLTLTKVIFPSGVEVDGLGSEARCMQCHQGRSSTTQVNDKIATAAAADDDTVSEGLSFQNVHYLAAGATLFGGIAKGGYQYDGMMYDSRNRHVNERDTCTGCHNPHTLDVKLDVCATCHTEATSVEGLAEIRMFGSTGDYDGDGDTSEGIKHEMEAMADTLYSAITAYATQQGAPIVYDAASHPYFFSDTNANGTHDEGEGNYTSWTNRLLRGAYNFQYYKKDPGAFAHNPKYVIEIMHDSINDLNSALTTPVAFGGDRSDAGHFDGSAEAWRHWDEDGAVPASCSKCHTGTGFEFFQQFGVTSEQPVGNGLACLTCHTNLEDYAVLEPAAVVMPSGETVSAANKVNNLCVTCHQGRESKKSVDQAIADNKLSFKNVHYLAAGATLFGTDAKVGYEYDGKTYAGTFTHTGGAGCVDCHAPTKTEHSFDVHDNADKCSLCHGSTNISSYRLTLTADYDGDGSTSEPLADELNALGNLLYAAMQDAATDNGTPLAYNGGAYPYFFADTNGNGVADPDESKSSNSFKTWTPALLKAAFNYQYSLKEAGAWAHNFKYAGQLLFDSIEDLGGDVSGLTRP
jgi:hypothetical protein